MSSKLRWVWVVGAIVLLAMVVAACAPAAAPTPERIVETVEVPVEVEVVETVVVVETVEVPVGPEMPITLDIPMSGDPPTLDPSLATDTTSVWVDEQLFIGLTTLHMETQEAIPRLATSWDISAEGTVFTFHLRDDAKWVHYDLRTEEVEEVGPVTAHDVAYGIRRTLDPRTASDYAYVLYVIKGGEDLNTADPEELTEEELQALIDGVGVEALDDYTLEITLEYAAAYFGQIAYMWVMRPMPQATIEEFGEEWTWPGNIVTNGPYVLAEWSRGAKMRFVKNPYYYEADKAQIELVVVPIVTESSTTQALYEAGEIDINAGPGWGVPLPDMDRIRADPVLSQELVIEPRLCTYFYGFVHTKPPMDNVLVRKAFAAAIDRVALIEHVLKGGQTPAHTFACPGIFGNAADDLTIAPYLLDIEEGKVKAQEFLAEAGYPNCEGLPEVTLMHNVSEGHALIAQAIQEMWRENLGCTVKIETMEWGAYLTMLRWESPDEDKPHIYRLGWCADYPDQQNWLGEVFHSKSKPRIKWDNPEFDALMDEGVVESDPARRVEIYNQAERIFVEEQMAIAPIYYYTRVSMFKPYVTEHPVNPSFGWHISDWKIDWEAKKAALGW